MDYTTIEYLGPIRPPAAKHDFVYDAALGKQIKATIDTILQENGQCLAKVPLATAQKMIKSPMWQRHDPKHKFNKKDLVRVNTQPDTVDSQLLAENASLREKQKETERELMRLRKNIMLHQDQKGNPEGAEGSKSEPEVSAKEEEKENLQPTKEKQVELVKVKEGKLETA